MSATILPFTRPSADALIDLRKSKMESIVESLSQKTRETLLENLSSVLMADHAALPWVVIDEALRAASEALEAGGMFLDAIVACEQVILAQRESETGRNHKLIDTIFRRRERRHQAFFNLAARVIDARLPGNSVHKHYALLRARRVIEGGGTINVALRHALGDDDTGGAA